MGDNNICEDEDECTEMADPCGAGETCVNEQGSYSCDCDAGYVKKGNACVKKVECNCKKNEKCQQGKCICKKGYRKDKRGHCHHVQKSYLAGSGDSIRVSSYLSALILGMLGRLAFTA
ncbi:thrombomodulin-like [Oculina patagonica]